MFSGLVIFDCDGVLVDSEGLVNEAESKLLRELGIHVGPEEARALFKGKTVAENILAVERMSGSPVPADWVYRLAMTTAALFSARLRSVPGVQQVLDALESRSVARCVASQSPPPRVELSLSITGLSRYFDERVYTASMVKRPKPAPDLFLYAASTLGYSPQRCVVIEDSPTGVLAASAASMKVYGYAGDGNAEELSRAGAVVFTEMSELLALLDV